MLDYCGIYSQPLPGQHRGLVYSAPCDGFRMDSFHDSYVDGSHLILSLRQRLRRTNHCPQVNSQPCVPFLVLVPAPHTHCAQEEGPLEGRVAFISASSGSNSGWRGSQGPVSCIAHPAMAYELERGQLKCTTASREMLSKCCISQHLFVSLECRWRNINNNTGHKIPATQHQSVSLFLHLHTAPQDGFFMCSHAPP